MIIHIYQRPGLLQTRKSLSYLNGMLSLTKFTHKWAGIKFSKILKLWGRFGVDMRSMWADLRSMWVTARLPLDTLVSLSFKSFHYCEHELPRYRYLLVVIIFNDTKMNIIRTETMIARSFPLLRNSVRTMRYPSYPMKAWRPLMETHRWWWRWHPWTWGKWYRKWKQHHN